MVDEQPQGQTTEPKQYSAGVLQPLLLLLVLLVSPSGILLRQLADDSGAAPYDRNKYTAHLVHQSYSVTLYSSQSQILSVESSLQLTNLVSLGAKLRPLIGCPPCAVKACTLVMLGSQYLMMPPLSAVIIVLPEWLHVIALTAVS
jgi:hypothetical protein